ncbi:MAG TPA: DUF2474 domain-containing protein, partial [Pantoea agglomerans]|nr:DUF2474 domain-containing protein [Pantoea agglomerans]
MEKSKQTQDIIDMKSLSSMKDHNHN